MLSLVKISSRYLAAFALITGFAVAQPNNNLLPGSFEEHLKSAQRGHAESQVLVGLAYQVNYLGVEQDFKKSTRWFRLAANQGHALAQRLLAQSYLHGLGVERNLDNAKERFKAAAEKGESKAQFMLASIYLDLEGYEQDRKAPDEVYKWLSRSAAQGYVPAFSKLASLYEQGLGVDANHSAARDWYKKSCEKGVSKSCALYKGLETELNTQIGQATTDTDFKN